MSAELDRIRGLAQRFAASRAAVLEAMGEHGEGVTACDLVDWAFQADDQGRADLLGWVRAEMAAEVQRRARNRRKWEVKGYPCGDGPAGRDYFQFAILFDGRDDADPNVLAGHISRVLEVPVDVALTLCVATTASDVLE